MKIFIKLLFCLAIVFSCIHCQTPDQDEVEVPIPGYDHKFYSGYIDINIFEKKSIHYVFFQSQNDVSKDPLVVWLSGGPGCSSLLTCFHQNGPFIFKPGKLKLQINQYAWNKKANLLFLELPAGVGFSTNEKEDEPITDDIFVQEAIKTLRLFLSRFQKMKKNDLYLTGHGYAGVYVTHLAKQMLDENNDPFQIFNDKWNLKGIMVGNPCTKPDECYASGSGKNSKYHYQFLHKRSFIASENYNQFLGECTFDYDSYNCYQQRIKLDAFFNSTNTSAYNIYDKCYRGQNDSLLADNFYTTDQDFDFQGLEYVNTGCQDEAGIINYLNDPIVQENWNIRPKEWQPCSSKVYNNYLPDKNSYYLYPELLKNHIRIWVYSGDLDSTVPVVGTKRWVKQLREQLQLPIRKNWREWWIIRKTSNQDQVGGFIWELQGLNLVTVKGAGFRAGVDKPQAMFELITGFLNGETLPYKN